MKAYIITGTSRGIGESLVEQVLHQGSHVHCISRQVNPRLEELARERQAAISSYAYDLNVLQGIDQLLEGIVASVIEQKGLEAIYLINNAGILSPVMPIEQCESEQIIASISTNLLAPMILTARFVALTKALAVDKRVLNISSGSAKYLLPNQSCYSTGKAGLDSFTRSIHLEQQLAASPVRIAAVHPGMIDTAMQAEIRSTSKEDFPYVDQFIQIANDGMLQPPGDTATKLLELLESETFGEVPLETVTK